MEEKSHSGRSSVSPNGRSAAGSRCVAVCVAVCGTMCVAVVLECVAACEGAVVSPPMVALSLVVGVLQCVL